MKKIILNRNVMRKKRYLVKWMKKYEKNWDTNRWRRLPWS